MDETNFFCCYRPPDQSAVDFGNVLCRLLAIAEAEHAILTVLGDLNAKHSSWDSGTNTAGNRIQQVLLDFSLSQLVIVATRVSPDGENFSTLDLYCTNRPDLVLDVSVSDPVSDHCCVTAYLNFKIDLHQPSRQIYHLPDFSSTDCNGMRRALSASPLLEAIQGTTDIDTCWLAWKTVFLDTIPRCAASLFELEIRSR